jgi:hypothetical protein
MIAIIILAIGTVFSFGSVGLITPNFHSLHLGERGSVLGGAIVARTDDASSAYYNPAGLVFITKDNFSASSSTYAANSISQTGSESGNGLNSIATYIANVGKYKKTFWSFSVPTPIYSSNTLTQTFNTDVPSSNVFDINSTDSYKSDFNVIAPGISIAKEISPTFRLGLSARLYMISLESSLSSSSLSTSASGGDPYQFASSESLNMNTKNARLEFGLQKDIHSNFRLGLMIKSPTKKITSNGTWSYESSDRQPIGSSYFNKANEKNLDFDFELPLEIHGGIAIIKETWDLELDVKYNHKISNRLITTKNIKYYEFYRDSTGVGQSYEEKENDAVPKYNFKETFNYAVSSSKKLGNNLLLSGALFTDFSPTKTIDVSTDLFTPIDLYGVTFGITKFNKFASTTVGAFYQQGEETMKKNDSFGSQYTEKLAYKNYGVTLSGSVYY